MSQYKRKEKKNYDYLIWNLNSGQAECKHCGDSESFPLPMPLNASAHWIKYFEVKHKDCEPGFVKWSQSK